MKRLLTLCLALLLCLSLLPMTGAAETSGNLLQNPGFEDGISDWTAPDGKWGTVEEESGYEPQEGAYFAWPLDASHENTYIYQDVSLSGYRAGDAVIFNVMVCNYDQPPHDMGRVELKLINAAGDTVRTYAQDQRNPDWNQQPIIAAIPAGAVTARVVLWAIHYVGSDVDAYYDDASLVATTDKYSMVYITEKNGKETALAGDTLNLTADNGLSKDPADYLWSSSYNDAATVDASGVVTFLTDAEDGVAIYAKDKKTGVVGVYWVNSDSENLKPEEPEPTPEPSTEPEPTAEPTPEPTPEPTEAPADFQRPESLEPPILSNPGMYTNTAGNQVVTFDVETPDSVKAIIAALEASGSDDYITIVLQEDEPGYGWRRGDVNGSSMARDGQFEFYPDTDEGDGKLIPFQAQYVYHGDGTQLLYSDWSNTLGREAIHGSSWALPELEEAADLGLIPEVLQGADLTQAITRAEFAAVCVKVYENLSDTTALPELNNPFTDTSDVEVLKAFRAGITNGKYDGGTRFAPDELLNRQEAATMLTRVFKRSTMSGWSLESDKDFPLTYDKPAAFADDASIDNWAKDSVYFMAANGIINGLGDNKFGPKNTTDKEKAQGYADATRQQALIIAVRMVKNLSA